MKINKQKGFTLIELLVVIAIIGLLSSIVMVSLNTARVKARNARRQSDFRQIQLAMDMYYDANNSQYISQAGIITAISTFMPTVPLDPLNTGSQKYTWVDNSVNNQRYCMYVVPESVAANTWYVVSQDGAGTRITTAPNLAACQPNT